MMTKPLQSRLDLIVLCAVSLVISGCGPTRTTGPEVSLAPDVESPCDATEERVGQRVEVGGEIAFVDDTDPGWPYADLEAEGCRVGITVETSTHRAWSEDQQATFTVGAQIVVQGNLASYPMPARPDEYQLIVELDSPPHALGEIPALAGTELPSLMPLLGAECGLSQIEALTEIQMQGEIVYVDDSEAAGLYAELDRDGCSVRLWVERTRWDTWSAPEQSLFTVGEIVAVEGILTIVLHEHFLDLSFPLTQADR